jgi:selenocysteine-specific elongation factor
LLDKPTCAALGDRLILRDASARHTVAGGRMLDVFPPTRHKRAAARLAFLHALAVGNTASALTLATESQPAGVDLSRFSLNANLSADAAGELWRSTGIRVIKGEPTLGFSEERWTALAVRLLETLAEEHQRAPDMVGVERDRLRRLTLPSLARSAFDQLLAPLVADGRVCVTGVWVHRPGHRVQISPADVDLWRVLKRTLTAAPYGPPRVRDVATASGIAEEAVRSLFKRAARAGELYPVAHDHYFTAAAVGELATMVGELCAEYGAARAAELRDRIGGGRKVAIHILEFFDRVGYTRRVRDEHVLRGESTRTWTT